MKYFILMLFTSLAFAEQPAYLKGSTIVVTLKDGKQYTFSGDQYKVVSRDSHCPTCPTCPAVEPAPVSQNVPDATVPAKPN